MGGIGSGRYWHYGAKNTTDDHMPIDIRRWQREGFLAPGTGFICQRMYNGKTTSSIQVRAESDHVILKYCSRTGRIGKWKDTRYTVQLDWTVCNFGGERPWFLCPAKGCGRRVAILYGGAIFACRHCHQLAYPSQREVGYDRAARRANKIREILGWKQGIFNPKGWEKPKGMHWSTFEQLNLEHDALVAESLSGMITQFGMLEEPRSEL